MTVDPGGEDAGWKGEVGLVPQVLEKTGAKAEGAVALVCGPPIMIKFSIATLRRMGFAPGAIYTTLENRMKCGVGKCGRCNAGPVYVCKDGPVFTAAEIERMPNDL
jgi:NAD(P)H-flavin reductase